MKRFELNKHGCHYHLATINLKVKSVRIQPALVQQPILMADAVKPLMLVTHLEGCEILTVINGNRNTPGENREKMIN